MLDIESLFQGEEAEELEARARRLEGAVGTVREQPERLVTFRRAEQRFALAAVDLLGARPLPKLVRLPLAPPHLLGLVHLNAKTVGVLDLERLGSPGAPPPATPWGLWVMVDGRSVVVAADELLDLQDVPRAELNARLAGAFTGTLASRLRAVLPGKLLVLEPRTLVDPTLYSFSTR